MADRNINDAFILEPLPRSPFATQATAGEHTLGSGSGV